MHKYLIYCKRYDKPYKKNVVLKLEKYGIFDKFFQREVSRTN